MYNARYSLDFLRLIEFIDHLFKVHLKTKSEKRQKLFEKFAVYNYYMIVGALLTYSSTILLFIPYPIYLFIFEDGREPIVSLFIPGVDEKQLNGYLITSTFQMLVAIFTMFGLVCVDSFYAIILLNVPIQSQLIEMECLELNKLLKEDDVKKENKKRPHIWKQRFYNILLMHLETST